ncbi:MAG: thymidine phosphorylase [Candidatus Velthaea sp.]
MDQGWLRRALAVKRDGGEIDTPTWTRIIDAYVDGTIDDAPVAALAMACTLRGMTDAEVVALTEAMIRSGDVLEIRSRHTVVDKHSSGGVGDAISLIVVPLVAACGVPVAKLSGRALAHTGGTLDKLEAVPGVRTDLSPRAFVEQVERIGCAIAAQTERIAPADKKLYALRDRTGTVPSPGLIAASIVSKKIAGGAGAIVFDVKAGGGAFMHTRADALALAEALVRLTRGCGRRGSAVVTDMDEPLAANVGTGAEAVEARDFLRGDARDVRLGEIAAAIGQEMLRVGGIAGDEVAARYDAALASGAAYEKFLALLEAQGAARATVERMSLVPERTTVRAAAGGYVTAIDAVAVGEAARIAVESGGPFAGVRIIARNGTPVARGAVLAEIAGAPATHARVAAAFTIGDAPPPPRRLIESLLGDAAQPAASNAGVQ